MKVVNTFLTILLLSSTLSYTAPRYKQQTKRIHKTQKRYKQTYQNRRYQDDETTCCNPTNIKSMLKISVSITKLFTTLLAKLLPLILN